MRASGFKLPGPAWAAVAPAALFALDAVATLRGQPAAYWNGAWHVHFETDPIGSILLGFGGPWTFAVLSAVWVLILVLLAGALNRHVAFVLGVAVCLWHAGAVADWCPSPYGFPVVELWLAVLCTVAIGTGWMGGFLRSSRSPWALAATCLLVVLSAVCLPEPGAQSQFGLSAVARKAFDCGDILLAEQLHEENMRAAGRDEVRHANACSSAAAFYLKTGAPDAAVRVLEPVVRRILREGEDGYSAAYFVDQYAAAQKATGHPEIAREAARYAAGVYKKYEPLGTDRARALSVEYGIEAD